MFNVGVYVLNNGSRTICGVSPTSVSSLQKLYDQGALEQANYKDLRLVCYATVWIEHLTMIPVVATQQYEPSRNKGLKIGTL